MLKSFSDFLDNLFDPMIRILDRLPPNARNVFNLPF